MRSVIPKSKNSFDLVILFAIAWCLLRNTNCKNGLARYISGVLLAMSSDLQNQSKKGYGILFVFLFYEQ